MKTIVLLVFEELCLVYLCLQSFTLVRASRGYVCKMYNQSPVVLLLLVACSKTFVLFCFAEINALYVVVSWSGSDSSFALVGLTTEWVVFLRTVITKHRNETEKSLQIILSWTSPSTQAKRPSFLFRRRNLVTSLGINSSRYRWVWFSSRALSVVQMTEFHAQL